MSRSPQTSYIVDGSSRENQLSSIFFTQENAKGVHFTHCEALVVRVVVAHNRLKQILVDNNSSVNVLFGATFDNMIVDHELTRITIPLYNFNCNISS